MLTTIIVKTIVLGLEILLAVYLYYTFVAIFNGAAPIPSRRSTVKGMMDLLGVKAGEFLVDLGSGDGRVLFAAASRGARCRGFEINPFLYWYTRLVIQLKRLNNVEVLKRDFWKEDLSQADIVTVYLTPTFMQKLETKVYAEMRPGSRVAAAVYPFPNHEPDFHDGRVFVYLIK